MKYGNSGRIIKCNNKNSSIRTKYTGGHDDYQSIIPNNTHCTQGQIDRTGLMTPQDTEKYISHLEQNGLISLLDGQFVDVAVVDMVMGPIRNCSWLGFARQKFFTWETQYDIL